MKKLLSNLGIFSMATLALTAACATTADDSQEKPGGFSGRGQNAQTGGASGAAGAVGNAGALGNAGSYGNGGSFGVGGASGEGGASGAAGGNGGNGGNGGASGSGGLGGSGGGLGGTDGMGGSDGVGGSNGVGGTDGVGGSNGVGGTDGVGGSSGASGSSGVGGVGGGDTSCCPDGNCLCHGTPPSDLGYKNGPFKTANYAVTTGTIHYPTDAQPPFAAVAICPGFLNSGPEMAPWGPFYASYGIVTLVTNTLPTDFPDIRATKLLAAVDELKKEGDKSSGQLAGKLSDRFGTSGYSMGGGGTTIASTNRPALKTSVGLAPWGPVGAGIKVPTLHLCGSADTVAPCGSGAQPSYQQIPAATPKMMIVIPGATHFNWFGPRDAGNGVSGMYALAFQKVFLEGDTRWKSLLLSRPASGTPTTNIQ